LPSATEAARIWTRFTIPVSATVNGSSSGVDYNNFVSGMITISHSEGVLGTGDVTPNQLHSGCRTSLGPPGTEFALQYKIKILPVSSAMFANVSLGVDIPGETKGFASSKQITGAGGFSHTLSMTRSRWRHRLVRSQFHQT
jgi:hypothetical protein